MDLKQIEYIIKIAEENNITKAAEKLFITQSALNQQLLRLEKELGTPLFHRLRNNWHLTEAGEIYVTSARQILNIKKDTYNKIHDISEAKKGHFTIGLAPGRGIAMFTAVYPKFRQLYPNISVSPIELGVRKQQELLAEGAIDLGFMTLSESQRTSDEYITILSEQIYLAIPSVHPLAKLAAPPGEPFAKLDIRLLQYEPFVMMFKESTAREIADKIFKDAGFEPDVLFETSSTGSIVSMVSGNVCCGLVPSIYTAGTKNITFFSIPSHPTWDITASYRKNSYLSKPMRAFVDLAAEYWL